MDMLPLKRAVNESGHSGGAYSIVWGVEGDKWAKENDFGLSVTKRYRKRRRRTRDKILGTAPFCCAV